jgi:hypothetical protein
MQKIRGYGKRERVLYESPVADGKQNRELVSDGEVPAVSSMGCTKFSLRMNAAEDIGSLQHALLY